MKNFGKKILIFSTAYFPFVGGAEIAVKEITDRISNVQFDMITARLNRKLPKFERVSKINIYRIGIGWPQIDKYLLALLGHKLGEKLNKKNQYNLVWSIMASYGGFAALSFKTKNDKIPFLLTLQEGDDLEHINKKIKILKARFKKIFIVANYIQTISYYLANWAKQMGARCSIEVVPNGVDIEKFKIQKSKLKNQKNKILITASRLVKKNAIDDVIKSLQYLPRNIKFFILGDGKEKEKLKELTKELKLENRVSFLGFVNHSEMINYFKDADIFIRPSLSEGLGNSFLEAMAVGIPVIATPVGGIPDFLRDPSAGLWQVTGLFCEVRNPKSIAEKVKLILEDEELRNKIIANAKEMVIKNYDWNLIAEKMKNIFNKLCAY